MKVNFETAKKAKEKGFELGSSNVWFAYKDGSLEEGTNFYTRNGSSESDLSNSEFTVYERPTQSELQAWLRKKLIFVEVNTDCTTAPKFCCDVKQFIGNPLDLSEGEWGWVNPIDENWGLHREWEDALEDGLVQGLDCI